jgi:hypothetical protein
MPFGLKNAGAMLTVHMRIQLFGLASGQVLRRSQGTLLPSSVNPRYRIHGTNV